MNILKIISKTKEIAMLILNFILNFFVSIFIKILKTNAIPKHVAFIMDGNRRFAKQLHVETEFGHVLGFQTLQKTLTLCLKLGITEVTIYAFSIENFKRSAKEVNAIMKLAKEKIEELVDSEELKKSGVAIRVMGDVTLLPVDVQRKLAETVLQKDIRKEHRCTLNICVSYTSREEIEKSMRVIAEGVKNDSIELNDIDERLFEKCLYSDSAPDILVRTSGETRLSDFLLWQAGFTPFVFLEVLWPAITPYHIFYIILIYQFFQKKSNKQKDIYEELINKQENNSKNKSKEERINNFLIEKENKDFKFMAELSKKNSTQN